MMTHGSLFGLSPIRTWMKRVIPVASKAAAPTIMTMDEALGLGLRGVSRPEYHLFLKVWAKAKTMKNSSNSEMNQK